MINPIELRDKILKKMEERINQLESKVKEKTMHEIKEGIFIKDLIQLKLHVSNEKIMSDYDLYISMISKNENNLLNIIKKLSANKEFIRRMERIVVSVVKRINLPTTMKKEDISFIVNNKEIKKTLQKGRTLLIKTIEKQENRIKNNEEEIVSQARNEELIKIENAVEKAYKKSIELEKLQKEAHSVLMQMQNKLIEKKIITKNVKELDESQIISTIKQIDESVFEKTKEIEEIYLLNQKRKEIEEKCNLLSQEIEKIIDEEIAEEKITEKLDKAA